MYNPSQGQNILQVIRSLNMIISAHFVCDLFGLIVSILLSWQHHQSIVYDVIGIMLFVVCINSLCVIKFEVRKLKTTPFKNSNATRL